MRNKYIMYRGTWSMFAGVAFNLLGWLIKIRQWGYYGWAMIIGTLLFGIGFLLVFYSLMRKVERQAILEDRAEEAKKITKEGKETD